ncbi:MAG: GPW/gp25 family protein [Candidatus Nanopelagicales bacterium]|jgi:phage baseplate assembly protein W|nr:GPW/gp25 family protein [Candidatus Nanopelagicales bacterium]
MSADRMGCDLRVVLGPPGMDASDSSALDLRLGAGTAERGREGYAVISGRENLAQALILRLLTPRGALADLGHAGYGSRLHELIGRHRDETSRALCKAFVLEAIAQEPRVEPKAVAFAFDPRSEGPSELRFAVTVTPVDGSGPLTVSLEAQL